MTASRLAAIAIVVIAAGGLIACQRSAVDKATADNSLRVDPNKLPPPAPYPRQMQTYPSDQRNAGTLSSTGHVALQPGSPPPPSVRR